MVALWQKGYFVVFGKRRKRIGESVFKKVTANYFYKILNRLSGDFIPSDTGEFRLIDKKINEYLMDMPEYDRFLRGMIAWIGFPRIGIEYNRDKREFGETKYTFRKDRPCCKCNIFIFNKTVTLAIVLGASTVIAIMILIYAVFMKIVGSPVPGWPTLVVMISFFSGTINVDRRTRRVRRQTFIQTKQRQYIMRKLLNNFSKEEITPAL